MKKVVQYIHQHREAHMLYDHMKRKYGIYESHPLIQLSMIASITHEVPEVGKVFNEVFSQVDLESGEALLH